MPSGAGILEELRSRGLLVQTSGEDELAAHLGAAQRHLYCGFDPTADSLHIGSLVPLLALRRFQLAGHRPIALVGGATGLVGDPSFKAAERNLNASDTVTEWSVSIRRQVTAFLDPDGPCGALVVNNLDWFHEIRLLDFLRDVGKHFSVNAMIQKDSVRQRIQREGEGISFAEFSYSILQAYDFAELNRRHGCSLQIGGSDQWGNIAAGIDLTRRQNRAQVHALTFPLITKSDGSKFGKSESGTVWLDPQRTSPYAFYQFWINCADADVYRFLGYFTFLPVAEIEAIRAADAAAGGRPEAQRHLAREVTRLVHGTEGLESAQRISEALFAETLATLRASDLEQLRLDGLPCTRLARADLDKPLTTLFVDAGAAAGGKQVKDMLGRGALQLNGRPCQIEDNAATAERFAREHALHGRFFVARLGKKKYHLFELAD